jgi:hypothetical protein
MNGAGNGAIIADLPELRLANVLVLLKTFLDMIALRKGPDALPSSWLVVYLSIAIFVIGWFWQLAMLGGGGEGRLWPILAGYFLELIFYIVVIYVFGFGRRIKQAMSAIIACGSIIAVVSVIEVVLMSPLLGSVAARAFGELIWYWSVPVKGHIIAIAIQQHWFVGVTIAIAAFIMRIGVQTAFAAQV